MPIRTSTARNFSEATENRMHSDDVAAQFGFSGALVPGVAVFGHMTHPLVELLGEDWLSRYRAHVRLRKPAYDRDELVIRHTIDGDQHTVLCHARGELLAELQSSPWDAEDPAPIEPGAPVTERPEIHWDNIAVEEPFPAWQWCPDAIANAEAAAHVEDDLDCYRAGVVHPHAILSMANRSFTHRYYLPAWLHVGSEIRFHRLLRVGENVEVRTVPTAKWRRKGHDFVDLRLLYLVAGKVVTEIVHTSIFKIADSRTG